MPAIKWNKVSNAKSYAIIFEDLNAKSNNGCNFIHLYIKYINKTINSIDKLKFDNKTIATLTNKLITKILFLVKIILDYMDILDHAILIIIFTNMSFIFML